MDPVYDLLIRCALTLVLFGTSMINTSTRLTSAFQLTDSDSIYNYENPKIFSNLHSTYRTQSPISHGAFNIEV